MIKLPILKLWLVPQKTRHQSQTQSITKAYALHAAVLEANMESSDSNTTPSFLKERSWTSAIVREVLCVSIAATFAIT